MSWIILLIGIGYYLYKQPPIKKSNETFYAMSASWGDCLVEKSPSCSGNAIIKTNGGYFINDSESADGKINTADTKEIINTVINTGIMDANCNDFEKLPDYTATYTFTINGNSKTIEYPGCGDLLDEIDSVIESKINK